MYFAYVALLIATVGLITCTGFFGLLVLAGLRFRKGKVPEILAELPPVTLLKPLCGLEPNLEQNLRSFFRQKYRNFEIVFGMRNGDDPALTVVNRVRRQFPSVPVKVVFSGEPSHANAKVCSLTKMYAAARYDYLVISDSDVEVTPNYLREVVAPLLKPGVGMVTCLYRGVATGGFWSRLEALGMSVEMTSGAIVANLVEGMKFALGPTMAVRRDALDAIGGFEALADYCSDDYVMGYEVARSGRHVVMSQHVIDHVVINRSFAKSMEHQIRWMKSTRCSRRAGHAGTALTFAVPFGLLALIAAGAMHRWDLGFALLGLSVLNRVILALVAGWGVVRDRRSVRYAWLYPLRDWMGFAFWCASYTGRTIVWRGHGYRLMGCGRMELVRPGEATLAQSLANSDVATPAAVTNR
jgi:ceramide glucosyltransferase